MSPLETYHQQHHEMIGRVTEILEHLDADTVRADSTHVHRLIGQFAEILQRHLAQEDRLLYPKLMQHRDEKVRATAQRYHDEMGGLSQQFSDYLGRWPTATDIGKRPADFVDETRTLLDQLAKRILREDTELYPLAARVGL